MAAVFPGCFLAWFFEVAIAVLADSAADPLRLCGAYAINQSLAAADEMDLRADSGMVADKVEKSTIGISVCPFEIRGVMAEIFSRR